MPVPVESTMTVDLTVCGYLLLAFSFLLALTNGVAHAASGRAKENKLCLGFILVLLVLVVLPAEVVLAGGFSISIFNLFFISFY